MGAKEIKRDECQVKEFTMGAKEIKRGIIATKEVSLSST